MANAKADFGVIGLGVMGRNLALNIRDHGFSIAVWNLEADAVEQFVRETPGAVGETELARFVDALARPRRMLMMIKAGSPVDEMLAKLAPLVDRDDVIIDGGNSWFKDTREREARFKDRFMFFGMGVSGGEEGARRGPSLMPGGERRGYESVKNVLEQIAAKAGAKHDEPCVTYVGPDGAGHFVKMVHNGIEYGDMQLIAEAYDLLRKTLGLQPPELAELFASWNRGRLQSFLIELTAEIFTVQDEKTGRALVDEVLDQAKQKGTGKWTAQVALDLGVPIPTIAAAIDARNLSSLDLRAEAQRSFGAPIARESGDRAAFIAAIEQALYASKICSYAQGLHLIAAGSAEYKWGIDVGAMARIWRAGCIIRAKFLDDITRAYSGARTPALWLFADEFRAAVREAEPGWRHVVTSAQRLGVPVPAMSASLAYYDALRAERLPQNLTQAQRDAFGAHTYERRDAPGKPLHTEWLKKAKL